MSEVQEKRKSKRIGINVKIKLQKVSNNLIAFGLKEEEFEVNVVNISKDGMAFRTKRQPYNVSSSPKFSILTISITVSKDSFVHNTT